ncbi:MAG: hypothetical protein K0R51_760 [Cytophagaceae bacterium]|jgi:acetyl esterase/lipase|nr:hypothetical protein [Cytophagaceae bacterium]
MKKLNSFLKYTLIIITALIVIAALCFTYFIFKNEAPITTGDIEFGVPYKNDQKLDIYHPTKKVYENSPVVFYIHGGAWITGNKITLNNGRFNGAANTLREKGYTIISPNYTLAEKQKSPFPDCILDIYEAVEWTKKHADLYHLDTLNMGLLGESAGAHIAMMLAFPDTTLAPHRYKKTNFNYLIDVYGPSDLEGIYHSGLIDQLDSTLNKLPPSIRAHFDLKQYVFGFDPSRDTLKVKDMFTSYSPVNFLNKNLMPVLIIHGKEDQIVPVDQSLSLHSKLDRLGVPNELHLLDHVNHGFINASKEQKEATQAWISNFVVKWYKK